MRNEELWSGPVVLNSYSFVPRFSFPFCPLHVPVIPVPPVVQLRLFFPRLPILQAIVVMSLLHGMPRNHSARCPGTNGRRVMAAVNRLDALRASVVPNPHHDPESALDDAVEFGDFEDEMKRLAAANAELMRQFQPEDDTDTALEGPALTDADEVAAPAAGKCRAAGARPGNGSAPVGPERRRMARTPARV